MGRIQIDKRATGLGGGSLRILHDTSGFLLEESLGVFKQYATLMKVVTESPVRKQGIEMSLENQTVKSFYNAKDGFLV